MGLDTIGLPKGIPSQPRGHETTIVSTRASEGREWVEVPVADIGGGRVITMNLFGHNTLGIVTVSGTVTRVRVVIESNTVPGIGAYATIQVFRDFAETSLIADSTFDQALSAGDVVELALEADASVAPGDIIGFGYTDSNGYLDNSDALLQIEIG